MFLLLLWVTNEWDIDWNTDVRDAALRCVGVGMNLGLGFTEWWMLEARQRQILDASEKLACVLCGLRE